MGLLPKVPSKPTPPTQDDKDAEAWARKLASDSKSAAVKQTLNAPQSSTNKTTQQNQSTSGYGQKPAKVVTTRLQTPSAKVASNAPFENTRFHLKEDNTANFEEYVRRTLNNPPAGKKYTFSGTLWATERAKEENAKNAHAGKQPPSGPDFAPPQRREPPARPATPQEPNHVKTKNKAPFSKQDPNMIFSPSQLAALTTDTEKVAKVQERPDSLCRMNTPWPTVPSTDVKHFNEKVTHELNASEKFFARVAAPLTQDALVTTTGFKPRDHCHNFEDQISDDGVIQDNVKEGIRATQGKDAATQLLDWDGKRWAPPPCD